MKLTLLLTALSVITLQADDKKAASAKPGTEAKSDAAAKTADLTAGSLTFKAAAPWVAKKEPRRMSAGGYTIPGKDGAAGVEADVYHFGGPGGGGDNEANIARWQKQFVEDDDGKLPEGKREEIEIGGKKVIFVTFKGTFLSGSVMDKERKPLPGYTMTGVIVPTDDGSIYFKIAGPDAAMAAASDHIKALVKSAFPDAK
jgi:hypothetical protein